MRMVKEIGYLVQLSVLCKPYVNTALLDHDVYKMHVTHFVRPDMTLASIGSHTAHVTVQGLVLVISATVYGSVSIYTAE